MGIEWKFRIYVLTVKYTPEIMIRNFWKHLFFSCAAIIKGTMKICRITVIWKLQAICIEYLLTRFRSRFSGSIYGNFDRFHVRRYLGWIRFDDDGYIEAFTCERKLKTYRILFFHQKQILLQNMLKKLSKVLICEKMKGTGKKTVDVTF